VVRPTLAPGSSIHITMEIFFVDRPLEGFGAVEITAPRQEEQQ
jgi:hypothetical protein